MKNLTKLGLSLTLMSVLSVTSFADETPLPPCVPGQTNSPPCSSQSVSNDSADPRELLTPPALQAVDVTDLTETVMWALSLF